ncbi:beta-lactamase domain protein [Coriobacterium glomerans PW2]|uniref:Beta-lactamase domain protein n=1 Tax=Coriobacterium glomerans (strain ATCC 49209 / DSM 20642 / JCM 10262 / PW2) TaxID=700015 RepID=F2N6X7_CORGP|nr:MBL fold metallo-hydrolase [Coriobacterium glomerans]AEB06176.1 beta-lactamase domain protein [Coriobacterium glomerans PW2]
MDAKGASIGTRKLHLHILGSGSKGNCALVEAPEGLIMIDDGFSRREVLARMHRLGLDETRVRALVLTHEHSDHVSGVGVWCRKFDGTIWASAGTAEKRSYLACLPFIRFEAGDALEIAGVRIQTFSTSHDVANPIGLRFSCEEDAIGFVTDTGILSEAAMRELRDVRILALESNHDVAMLRGGSYPRMLQDRIASSRGHLSNAQAAEAAVDLVGEGTEQIVCMHISLENNRPSLAVRALAAALKAGLDDDLGCSATLRRTNPTRMLRIGAASQFEPMSFL